MQSGEGRKTTQEAQNDANPIDVYVGKRVRERRQKLGWTLVELAERLNVSHQQIQKYEQGATRISASVLYQLSTIFQTNQNYFFEGFKLGLGDQISADDIIALESPKHPLRIMLVEDDPADELLTRKAIEESQQQASVHTFHDGEQALHFLKHMDEQKQFPRPDMVLLDLNIPRRDGHTVLKEIKRDRSIQDIPVVVLTNSISKQEMQSVYKNGASGYICKSFDYGMFADNVKSILHYWGETVVLPSHH